MNKSWGIHTRSFFAGLVTLLVVACGGAEQPRDAVSHRGPVEVNEILEQHPEILVIDVRTAKEFNSNTGHIKGAVLHPVDKIGQWAKEIDLAKDEPIVLVCAVGGRSAYAANYLKEQGFTNLINLKGGMVDWNRHGFPVEKTVAAP